MPTLTLNGRNVTLTSSWTYAQSTTNESGWTYGTPTTVYDAITFSFSSIPSGASINSVQFSSSTWGSGATMRIDCGGSSFTSSSSISTSAVSPGGNLTATFTYKATGGVPGTSWQGTKSSTAGWTNITLTVSYTEPLTAPYAPSSVSVSPSTAFPEETVTLSWSGASAGTNNPIRGYTIYKSTTSSGSGYSVFASVSSTSSSGSITFTAPAEGTSYYKVMTQGSVSNSSMSSRYATLSIDLSATSEFTVDATSINAGGTLTLSISSAADLAHTVTITFGDYKEVIEMAANEISYAFTPPLEWLNAIPNSSSGVMTIVVKTEGGGTKTQTVTLRCPDDIAPVIGEVSIERVDGTVPSDWEMYIAGFSKVKATILTEATEAYSSPIVMYQITGGGALAEFEDVPNGMTTGYLAAGTQAITFSATDGRGRTGTKTITVDVYPYVNPFLTDILSLRSNAEGKEDDEGLYATCSATLNFASIGGKNSATCAVSYRPQGGSEWKTAGMLDGILLFGGDIALADNYEIRYTIMDAVGGTGVSYDIVTRAVREIDIMRGGGAWAIGGIANEKGALKVYGLLRVVNDAVVTGNMTVNGNFGFYKLISLAADGWEQYGTRYTKAVTVEGLPEIKGRPPMITPQNSVDADTAQLEDEAWANIYYVGVEGETLTFYAYEQPTQDLQLHVSVV